MRLRTRALQGTAHLPLGLRFGRQIGWSEAGTACRGQSSPRLGLPACLNLSVNSWEEQLVSEEKPVSKPSSLGVREGEKKKKSCGLLISYVGETAHQ